MADRRVALSLLLVAVLWLCGCPCSSTVLSVHDGDHIRTTIVAPYAGDAARWSNSEGRTCMGINDLVPGTTLTMRVNFNPPSDGCPSDRLTVAVQSTNSPTLSPTIFGDVAFQNANGCSGVSRLEFVPVGSDPSLYRNDNSADGGAVDWLLGRSVFTLSDGGCNVVTPCSDMFVATDQQL